MDTDFIIDLKKRITGDVRADLFSKNAYAIDASIYQIQPLVIVLPRSTEDVRTTVSIGNKYNIPIIPRGAGTGITGGCLGRAIIVDFSKYMNRILDINYDDEYVICQPGVVQDQLNRELMEAGYRLGPDTSTGNRATIGGMLGNNSSGAHSMRYGKMVDNVLSVELLLANETCMSCRKLDMKAFQESAESDTIPSKIGSFIQRIRKNLADEINQRFPEIRKRVLAGERQLVYLGRVVVAGHRVYGNY